MNLLFLGLSITSSWGNGHATTYRGLLRELAKRGHAVTFLEADAEWYASNRDLPAPPYCRAELYADFEELKRRFANDVREADAVIVGSYVPDGVRVGAWVLETSSCPVAFYDIDTPVTLAQLSRGECAYLSPELVARYHLYCSFSGGPTLQVLEQTWGSPRARALYCSVDPESYFPDAAAQEFDLTYLGTYSPDRQPTLDALLLQPARAWREGRFFVAGPQYPNDVVWPDNVKRANHLPPSQHRSFYASGKWTLNVTRADMVRAGWSPSVRLFEAAACGVPVISDVWPGLEDFFVPDEEIILAPNAKDSLRALREIGEESRARIGHAARARVLGAHTSAHRAQELESYLREL